MLSGVNCNYPRSHLELRFSLLLLQLVPLYQLLYLVLLYLCKSTYPYHSLLCEYSPIFANGLGGITLLHHFCAAARWKISLRVMEDFVAEFAARKRVLLLEESIADVLCTHY